MPVDPPTLGQSGKPFFAVDVTKSRIYNPTPLAAQQ